MGWLAGQFAMRACLAVHAENHSSTKQADDLASCLDCQRRDVSIDERPTKVLRNRLLMLVLNWVYAEQSMRNKCQRCSELATLHITEVEDHASYREIHLCYKCAHIYLQQTEDQYQVEAQQTHAGRDDDDEQLPVDQKECPNCKLTFRDFRRTGRLGCPNDYDVFREELTQLIENLQENTVHQGKTPQRVPRDAKTRNEIMRIRQEMQKAIAIEDYEQAAKLRDRIESLEK